MHPTLRTDQTGVRLDCPTLAIALGMFEVVFIVTMALEKHDPEVVAREVSLRALESRADVNTAMMLMVCARGIEVSGRGFGNG